ncbi:glycerophosphodiester phosphodiesterase [Nocardiopsis gilva YIM 90087]|uniref:glycerophosphodiester phosphodiesterase n=1 Tax=Nocardiopsis gilva YIM 90087 TaxID=1235441 RepID=A0A223SB74_9ACTN|nr:glycerophosphodiester phosphodiesterase family protein [Nocardiopsis gilva]ASU85360.1 glycerophosphodiester phosphodiesterase [Nocardiopsis gilva YIM 90087]
MRHYAAASRRIALTTPVIVLGLLAGAAPAAAEPATHDATRQERPVDSIVEVPWIIAHRGASAYRPEHTLASYFLAVRMRADVIEPDLVPTSDGHLISRHENELSDTTDVADHPEFADRRTTKTIDGKRVTGWFSEDFTLAEIKTLRAVERLPDIRPRSARHDGKYEIPTFEEVLDLRDAVAATTGRDLKVIPEIKHGAYFDSIGLDAERKFAEILDERGLSDEDAPVVVQSFEPDSARELNDRVDIPVVQLIGGHQRHLTTPEGLDEIATYADAIGPTMRWVLPIGDDGLAGEPTSLVADAHDRDLLVTPWTLRSENEFLPAGYRKGDDPTAYGDYRSYYIAVLRTGVDGVFTDSPDHLYKVRRELLREKK